VRFFMSFPVGELDRLTPMNREAMMPVAARAPISWLNRGTVGLSYAGWNVTFLLLGFSAFLAATSKKSEGFSQSIEVLKVAGFAALAPVASVTTCCVVTGVSAVKALCQQGCDAAKRVCADSKELIGDAMNPYPRMRQWRQESVVRRQVRPVRLTNDGL
jgi:hypothetical protein